MRSIQTGEKAEMLPNKIQGTVRKIGMKTRDPHRSRQNSQNTSMGQTLVPWSRTSIRVPVNRSSFEYLKIKARKNRIYCAEMGMDRGITSSMIHSRGGVNIGEEKLVA